MKVVLKITFVFRRQRQMAVGLKQQLVANCSSAVALLYEFMIR